MLAAPWPHHHLPLPEGRLRIQHVTHPGSAGVQPTLEQLSKRAWWYVKFDRSSETWQIRVKDAIVMKVEETTHQSEHIEPTEPQSRMVKHTNVSSVFSKNVFCHMTKLTKTQFVLRGSSNCHGETWWNIKVPRCGAKSKSKSTCCTLRFVYTRCPHEPLWL